MSAPNSQPMRSASATYSASVSSWSGIRLPHITGSTTSGISVPRRSSAVSVDVFDVPAERLVVVAAEDEDDLDTDRVEFPQQFDVERRCPEVLAVVVARTRRPGHDVCRQHDVDVCPVKTVAVPTREVRTDEHGVGPAFEDAVEGFDGIL